MKKSFKRESFDSMIKGIKNTRDTDLLKIGIGKSVGKYTTESKKMKRDTL